MKTVLLHKGRMILPVALALVVACDDHTRSSEFDAGAAGDSPDARAGEQDSSVRSDAAEPPDAHDVSDAEQADSEALDAALEDASALDAGDGGALDGGDAQVADTLTPAEHALLGTLSPLPAVPPDTTNRVAESAAAAALGQKLYFDKKFSGALRVDSDLGTVGQAGRVACASCHSSAYLDDDRSAPDDVSLGTDFHTRNAPPLVNAAFYKWTNWGGRFSAQWELPLAVLENPIIMNGNRLQLAHRIFASYRSEYEAVFGALPGALADTTRFPPSGKPKPVTDPVTADGAWEGMSADDRLVVNTLLVNYSKSIAAYMRLLVSRDAPFDRWLAGNEGAVDAATKRGAKLFVEKARCITCHSGPHLSDGGFHNLGLAQTGAHVPASDDGRFKDVPALLASAFNSKGAFSDDTATDRLAGLTNPMPNSAKGAFRTASLRGIALTAPYMHAGQLATLEAVIDFYDAGGGTATSGSKDAQLVPLHLSADEKADLKAFLQSLTGANVPASLLSDSSAP